MIEHRAGSGYACVFVTAAVIDRCMHYERANIRAMSGYSAGEQPEQPGVIKLNTNENPYPASDAVERALQSISVADLRRYPPPLAQEFREAAAARHGVAPENIIATNGGDELLRLAVATYLEPGRPLGMADPSYSLYPVLAAAHGSPVARVPLAGDWSLPGDFAERLNREGAGLAFVVNPHAPTGLLRPAAQLAELANRFEGVLVLDEAYVDFVDPEIGHDTVPLLREFDNVLILRTLSKGYSLAGLRLAYGMGSRELLEPMLYKTRDSYNTDFIAQKLATAALRDQTHASRTWQRVREQRQELQDQLHALGFECLPSQSNFILVTPPGGEPKRMARSLYERLKKDGILIRYFDQPRLDDKLRISIGTEAENQQLIQRLRDHLAGQ